MSAPEAGLPAWLRFDWEAPVDVRRIQLTFDTGLHRHLTLSHHDGYAAQMLWGSPQPETVRDYTIEGFDGQQWSTLLRVTDNYQRLRRHTLSPQGPISALRIIVEQTGGLNQARICEIRLWSGSNNGTNDLENGAARE